MKRVLLIHQDRILHYRVSIYNHLSKTLHENQFSLTIASNGIEKDNSYKVGFNSIEGTLSFNNLMKLINKLNPHAIILFVNLKHLYLFPTLVYSKLKHIKILYWGHGINLEDKTSAKNILYDLEHELVDSIILYAGFLKKYIKPKHYKKIFIANNTLNTTVYDQMTFESSNVLSKYNIKTKKNIICMGRMQKRKRIPDLINAFDLLKNKYKDLGLVLVGPDTEGILTNIHCENMYIIDSIYGKEALELLSACDVYCLPGHVGLSIVDAFYCGLPIVTEDVDHAPEITYLKDGINGFTVPKGDISTLAKKLELLLRNDSLREKFSKAAKYEIQINGHIDVMCKGFLNALEFVFSRKNNV